MQRADIIEWLDKASIEAYLSPESKARLSNLQIFTTLDSTNTYLLQQARGGLQSGSVCLAEEQTHGRGRQANVWYSPKGTNIYASLLWHFSAADTDLAPLSLAVAVMVMNALRRYGIVDKLQLKWPNDIYCAERKLAGILIETLPQRAEHYPVVIGVGLNLQLSLDNPVAATAIAVEDIVGNNVSRNQLAGLLIDECLLQLPRYVTHGFSAFIPEWRAHDLLQGKAIAIHEQHQVITGVAHGINTSGELLLRRADGELQAFRCGEVSVRFQSDQ